MKFEVGKEYKTIKKNMEVGVRTFKVKRVSHKNMAVEVTGAINGIFRMTTDFNGDEYICLGLDDRNYCNPCAKDVLD